MSRQLPALTPPHMVMPEKVMAPFVALPRSMTAAISLTGVSVASSGASFYCQTRCQCGWWTYQAERDPLRDYDGSAYGWSVWRWKLIMRATAPCHRSEDSRAGIWEGEAMTTVTGQGLDGFRSRLSGRVITAADGERP